MSREHTEPGAASSDGVPDLTAWERLGETLFRARSATPIALILVAILWPTPGGLSAGRGALAAALVVAGEAYRLLSVGTAGKCTRTRGKNVKELVTTGPFAHVRNPLYIGNFVLTYGIVVISKVGWLLWAMPVAFFVQYGAVVAWEERILRGRFGREYEDYRSHVPTWIPSIRAYGTRGDHGFRGRIAFQSERDTLRTVVIVCALLAVKHVFFHQQIATAVRAALRAVGAG